MLEVELERSQRQNGIHKKLGEQEKHKLNYFMNLCQWMEVNGIITQKRKCRD